MRIEVLIAPNCPHAADAVQRMRQALDTMGMLETNFTIRMVHTAEDAEVSGFHGSPTFQVDGIDIFPNVPDVPPLKCRCYPSELVHVPDLNQLREAIQAADRLT